MQAVAGKNLVPEGGDISTINLTETKGTEVKAFPLLWSLHYNPAYALCMCFFAFQVAESGNDDFYFLLLPFIFN